MWIKLDYRVVRPILSRILPAPWLVKLYSSLRPFALSTIKKKKFSTDLVDLPVDLWGLHFRNPLGVAAGFDKDGSLLPFLYQLGAGYVVVGTALNKSHQGNPGTPWVPLNASHAAINNLGLPSPGVDEVLQNIQIFKNKYNPSNFPIGLSIMGHPKQSGQEKEDGLIECLEKAQGVVDFIELNQSCPNVGEDLEKLDVPEKCFDFDTPIVLKLQQMPPQEKIIKLCKQGKIAGIVLSNTVKEYNIDALQKSDRRHAKYFQQKFGGGLSGPALHEKNIKYIQVWENVLKDTNTILIGCGGIRNAKSNYKYLQHTKLTQVYTGLWEVYARVGAKLTWRNFFV